MKNFIIKMFIYAAFGLAIGFLIGFTAGCEEVESNPGIKPLNQQLVAVRQDWKEAYGDSLDSQLAYNLVLLRTNQILIANVMNKMHPNDPNDPNNLKARIERLEANINDPNKIMLCSRKYNYNWIVGTEGERSWFVYDYDSNEAYLEPALWE